MTFKYFVINCVVICTLITTLTLIFIHVSKFDSDFSRLSKLFSASIGKCNNVSDTYLISNLTYSNNITIYQIKFDAIILEKETYGRSTHANIIEHNITIQIPSYIDYRLYSKHEIMLLYPMETLVNIYTTLYNNSLYNIPFECIIKNDYFIGIYGKSKLQSALILLLFGYVFIGIIIIYFIGLFVYYMQNPV